MSRKKVIEMKKIALVIISIFLLSGLAHGKEPAKPGSYDREYHASGQLKFEFVINDPTDSEAEGIAVTKGYYENGRLEYEIIAKDGNLEYGIFKDYYKNGKLKELRSFKNDEYHGLYISYNKNGQLIFIGIYEDGNLIDWKDYHKDEGSIIWG